MDPQAIGSARSQALRPMPARRLAGVLDPVIPRVGGWLRQRPGALSLAQGMVNWGPPQNRSSLSDGRELWSYTKVTVSEQPEYVSDEQREVKRTRDHAGWARSGFAGGT